MTSFKSNKFLSLKPIFLAHELDLFWEKCTQENEWRANFQRNKMGIKIGIRKIKYEIEIVLRFFLGIRVGIIDKKQYFYTFTFFVCCSSAFCFYESFYSWYPLRNLLYGNVLESRAFATSFEFLTIQLGANIWISWLVQSKHVIWTVTEEVKIMKSGKEKQIAA